MSRTAINTVQELEATAAELRRTGGVGVARRATRRLPRPPHEWRPLGIVWLLLGAQVTLLNTGTPLTSASHSAVLLNLYAVHTVVLAHFHCPPGTGSRCGSSRGP